MPGFLSFPYTSFDGHRRLASGPLSTVAVAARRAAEGGAAGPVLIFENATGRQIDVDMRGSDEEVAARLAATVPADDGVQASDEASADGPRGRGRPKLGVVAREVTLLPRHWDWLASQPGGASVTLRKLVEEARRVGVDRDRVRQGQDRAYHFMLAVAGDLPGFEEATRALFANDRPAFETRLIDWPRDVRDHAVWLAFGG